jgi:hypothetical protein
MSDNRNELLAHLRDAARERQWLVEKTADFGPSSRDLCRARDADARISDLVCRLRGYGVEQVFAELEAEPHPEQTKQQRLLLARGGDQSSADGKQRIVVNFTPTVALELERDDDATADWAVYLSERADEDRPF